jgi:hypothetical protein
MTTVMFERLCDSRLAKVADDPELTLSKQSIRTGRPR